MALTDDQLLDFDPDRLAHFDLDEARQTLAGEHGDIFRAQLVAAPWINGWRERTVEYDRRPGKRRSRRTTPRAGTRRCENSSHTCATAI
jgi:hypothetical protein